MTETQDMPDVIYTDINGNAARNEYKGSTKYIRADIADKLTEALERYAEGFKSWKGDAARDAIAAYNRSKETRE